MLLDCGACKTAQAMEATAVPRFGRFIRFLGFLIVTPSLIGLAIAALLLIYEVVGTVQGHEPAFALFGALAIAFPALLGGLVGWLLLTKRKVYKCRLCGFVLDRA